MIKTPSVINATYSGLNGVNDIFDGDKLDLIHEISEIALIHSDKLKNIGLIRPTIHKYLSGYTKSQFRRIDADEFTIAVLLPVQRFEKATDKEVWKESRSMI